MAHPHQGQVLEILLALPLTKIQKKKPEDLENEKKMIS